MKRALIVDDVPENLYLLRAMLQGAGYTVDEATHGAEALDRARKLPPDLIISDLLMPGMDGYTLLRHWKADDRLKSVPFIVYTATYTDPKAQRLALNLGAVAFILKPSEQQPLIALLDEIMAGKSRGELPHGPENAIEEAVLLKEYNEVLIQKLEEKALQLNRSNRELRAEIAEHKGTETAVRAGKAVLRLFVENVSVPIAMVDREMRYLCVSRPWLTDYHLGDRDIIGLSHYEVFPELPEKWKELYRRCLAGETNHCDEAKFERADGSVQWIRWEIYPWMITPGEIGGIIMFTEDISRRKSVTDAVRLSEQRYRTLIDAITAIVWNSPPSGAFDSDQPAWTAFTGQTVEQHRGLGWLDVVHPEDRLKSDVAWKKAVAERTPYRIEHRLRRADGEYRYMSVRAVASRDSTGAIVEWVGIHTDITERKNSEALLIESQHRLALATESAHIGIWDWDTVTNTMMWDAQMYALYGVNERDFNNAFDVWRSGLHPDDRIRKENEIAAAMAGTKDFNTEVRVIWPSGEVRHIEAHGVIQRAPDGTATRMIGVNWDITERKRNEADLLMRDRAIHAISQGLLITDARLPDNPIIYASPSFQRMTGYDLKEILGRNCRFLKGKLTDATALAEIRDTINNGQSCAVELLNYRKDGKPFWNHLEISPVLDSSGILSHFVGVQTDVTERRLLEEQYRQAQKMEAVGQLAGGVAHDFNNMLTIVNGYSEMLIESLPAEDPNRASLSEIRNAGERAATLTRQLLAFSRKQVLETKVLNLNGVIADTETMLRRLIGEDIIFVTTLDPSLESVNVDPGQIAQLLINLAVNARDAMPRGGHLTIETQNAMLDAEYCRAHPDLESGKYVLLAVSDNGCGMDEATRSRIFEPFFTTKDVGKGTGLGLATVHGIVKQSQGHIAVYSEVDRGTTFKVYLPSKSVSRREATTQPEGHSMPSGSETVLLVEDEDAVRTLAQRILTSCGYRVLAAANGQDAIKLSQTHPGPIHILISDVVMPHMGGRELAERIVGMRSECRLLFLSGYTDDAVIRHGVIDAEYAFLQKPFTPSLLAHKIRLVLDKH